MVTAWLMIAALATARTTQLWLFAPLAAATALWLVVKAGTETANTLPWIFCSNSNSEAATPRPRSLVKTLRSEPLVTARGKHVTAQLVHLPPRAFSPRHVHGGDVTAYVLNGTVRSEHAGLPAADFHAGEMFYEPYGTTHVFLENPSATESADVLAITVHDEGAPLTTFLD
jgi:quercetin dioxygenase-like cupin family protein